MKNQKNYYEIVRAYKVREAILDGEYYISNRDEHMERSRSCIKNIECIERDVLRPYLKRQIFVKNFPVRYFLNALMCLLTSEGGEEVLTEDVLDKKLSDFDKLELNEVAKVYKLNKRDSRLLHEWDQLRYLPVYVEKFIKENDIKIVNNADKAIACIDYWEVKPVIDESSLG